MTFLNCLNISSQISFCFLTADPCLFQSITHVIVSSIKEALIWRLLSHFCNADWTTFARTSSCNYALRLCSSFNKIAHFSRRESIHKSTASPLLPRCSITTQVSHKLWRSYYTGIWKHFGESLQLGDSNKPFSFINQNPVDKNIAKRLSGLVSECRDYKPLILGCKLNKSRATLFYVVGSLSYFSFCSQSWFLFEA